MGRELALPPRRPTPWGSTCLPPTRASLRTVSSEAFLLLHQADVLVDSHRVVFSHPGEEPQVTKPLGGAKPCVVQGQC